MSYEAELGIKALLVAIGEDPEREGVRDTPKRVLKAFKEMTGGMHLDPADILGTTFDGGDYDEVVIVRNISFVSICEHHLLTFSGTADVAYLPAQVAEGKFRVVGLSKIPRVVDVFARRLQLQEQMTSQIASALEEHLKPRGVAVLVQASHSCMECRGVKKAGASMITSVMRGIFKTDVSARAELMALLRP